MPGHEQQHLQAHLLAAAHHAVAVGPAEDIEHHNEEGAVHHALAAHNALHQGQAHKAGVAKADGKTQHLLRPSGSLRKKSRLRPMLKAMARAEVPTESSSSPGLRLSSEVRKELDNQAGVTIWMSSVVISERPAR